MINRFLDEQTDTLDATVFSGDCLLEKENREHLKEMIASWSRQIKEYEETEGVDDDTSID